MTIDISPLELEEIAFKSWMPKEVEKYGGWYLRYNAGITRRANSVLPIAEPPRTSLIAAVDHVIDFYSERGIPPRFQMTDYSLPDTLDNVLANQGFLKKFPVEVQVAKIEDIPFREVSMHVDILGSPTEEWMRAYHHGSGYAENTMDTRRALMERSPLDKAFGAAKVDDEIVSVGLCVLAGNWCGLFNIATVSGYRRLGAGTSVNLSLVKWARDHGSKYAYLQVETNNEPALSLYRQLGFETLYDYWYRVNPL